MIILVVRPIIEESTAKATQVIQPKFTFVHVDETQTIKNNPTETTTKKFEITIHVEISKLDICMAKPRKFCETIDK